MNNNSLSNENVQIGEQTKKWIDKYFASMPKGQAINLYRDYLAYDNTTFQTKYGVEKSVFDENMFFLPTCSRVSNLLCPDNRSAIGF